MSNACLLYCVTKNSPRPYFERTVYLSARPTWGPRHRGALSAQEMEHIFWLEPAELVKVSRRRDSIQ